MQVTVLDLETRHFGAGNMAPAPLAVSLKHGDNAGHVQRPREVSWSFLDDDLILGSNIAYDLSVLMRHVPETRPKILQAIRDQRFIDVQHAARLQDIASGAGTKREYNLAVLSSRYLRESLAKDAWRMDYPRLDGVPAKWWPQGAVDYAIGDVETPARVFQRILDNDPQNLHLLGHVTSAAWALNEMTVNGVHTNEAKCQAFLEATGQYLEKGRRRLHRAGLLRRNRDGSWGSMDEKAARAYMERVNPDGKRGKKGASLDAESAEASGSRLLQLRADCVSANTLDGRARRMLDGSRGTPLHPSYWVLKETYRTSASAGDYGFQIQNMPKPMVLGGHKYEMRDLLEPLPGEGFIQADLAQAELFSLAQVCLKLFGFSVMGDQLRAGVDLHWYMAAKLLNCTIVEAKARPDGKKYRTYGKICNFSLPGGLGPAKLCQYARANYNMIMSLDEARELKATWLAAFPEMRRYLDNVNQLAANSGKFRWSEHFQKPMPIFDHVHPLTGFERGEVGYSDGLNQYFQHVTAVSALSGVTEAVCQTWEGTDLKDFKLFAFVHDEMVGRGPYDRCPEAADLMSSIMCREYLRLVPDYPITAPPAFAKCWHKDMEAVRDARGRLQEWTRAD